MCDWGMVQAIGTVLGVVVVAPSLGFAAYQIGEARRTRTAEAINTLYDELQTEENRITLKAIYDLDDIKKIETGLDRRIELIVNKLDRLGTMVAHHVIDERLTLALVRGVPLRCWYRLQPYIDRKRGPNARGHYARFLEDYVVRSTRYQLKKVPKEQWTQLNGMNLVECFDIEIRKGRWKEWKTPK